MYCSSCKNSIFNTFVGKDGKRANDGDPDAVRVPLIFYFVVGQAADTGPPLGINDPGVKLPSFVRAMMLPHVPVARVELCMICVSEVFGVPLLTAEEDPLYSAEQESETKVEVEAVVQNAEIDEVATAAKVMERPLLALKVGRGAEKAPPLPRSPKQVAAPAP